ncbi:MAG: hypothetical protein CBR30_00510 [Dictyoglomus sp. NZ13-RE01]|nr:MAG: hypothetical protein CBR30_00510 [Dictyoglomus sp. NZ13-RE01]
MANVITVFVNDEPVKIYQGMQVMHALISYNIDIYKKCLKGECIIFDENGFEIGLEGALHDGSKIYIKEIGE